ncbi:hypothetical protein ACJU26_09265 [Acidithiobacillus sp. M4-SHS-6]|uniref:hypothetical protein n=1 Tax=Acidithiobacillus sp. M4-SHS-6 TaxID=3383024 RepID=UPI0039BDD31C
MSSLLVWGLAILLVLFILDRVPGVRLLAKPIIESIAKTLALFVGSFGLWILFLVKSTIRSHVVFLQHLTQHREKIAPEERIKADGTLKNPH